uniref:Uncharacterized protein n=1 Tax=Cacopsylla melanoneura TaxID=428564 RepID=A0A8D8RGV6_9HEMI
MNMAGICLCMYAILVPGLLSNFALYKTILETTAYSIAYCTLFATGEYLASFKLSWRSALIKSYWYKCSTQTTKLVPLVLLANQEHDYLNVKGLIPGNNVFMVNMIKTAYSAFNFMRMKAAA